MKMDQPIVGLLITALLEDDWNKTAHLRPTAQAAVANFVHALEGMAKVVCPGLVETEEQAAAADLAFKASGVQAVVYVALAYTQSLVPLRALSQTKTPVIIWNTQQLSHWPEDADWDVVMLNSGLAGLPELTYALSRSGRKFHVVTGHLNDPHALKKLEGYLRAASLIEKLRWSTIGMVGHPYQFMADLMVDSFALREAIGPTVVHVEPEEIAAAVEAVVPAEARRLANEAKQLYRTDELDPQVFERSARYAAGLEKVVSSRKLDALAHFDQCLLSDPRCGVVPSWGECRLMAAGIPVVAEADVLTCAGMLILQGCGGEASFIENYGFDFDQGAAYLAHDSIGNPNLAAAEPRPALRHSVYYQGRYGMGAAMEFAYRPGQVTLLSLVALQNNRWKMVVGEGEALPFQPRPTVAPQMLFQPAESSLESYFDRWCLSGAGHHSAIAYRISAGDLNILAKMLEIDYELVR